MTGILDERGGAASWDHPIPGRPPPQGQL